MQTEINLWHPKEDVLTRLLHQVPALIAYVDTNFRFCYLNEAYANWYGITPAAAIGRTIHEVLEEEADQALLSYIEQALSGVSVRFEYSTTNAGGIKLLDYECTPDADEEGHVNGCVLMGKDVTAQKEMDTLDITEKKQAERTASDYYAELEEKVAERTAELVRKNEALRKSEERYHNMIAEVQDYAILLMDTEGNIQDWNTGAEKIKGYKKEEIVGKNFRLFYTSEDRERKRPEKLIGEAVKTGKANDEGWRVRKDGTLFWASVTITALHNKAGEVIGFSKVTRDLTERKKAEEQLRDYAGQLQKKNEALNRANKELEQFTYMASHDMKEPLRKISLYSDFLLINYAPELPDKGKEMLHKSIEAAKRMQKLIDDLLTYSRTTVTTQTFEPVDLNTVLQQTKNNYKEALDEKKGILEWDTLPVVQAIPFQMEQLFDNLINNSLKYQPAGQQPVIKITYALVQEDSEEMQTESGYHKITVADNGIGFRTEQAEKIFEVFQRLYNRQSYSGTGIGLAICKKIAENHNGFIQAEGKENAGAQFHVYLPAQQNANE